MICIILLSKSLYHPPSPPQLSHPPHHTLFTLPSISLSNPLSNPNPTPPSPPSPLRWMLRSGGLNQISYQPPPPPPAVAVVLTKPLTLIAFLLVTAVVVAAVAVAAVVVRMHALTWHLPPLVTLAMLMKMEWARRVPFTNYSTDKSKHGSGTVVSDKRMYNGDVR